MPYQLSRQLSVPKAIHLRMSGGHSSTILISFSAIMQLNVSSFDNNNDRLTLKDDIRYAMEGIDFIVADSNPVKDIKKIVACSRSTAYSVSS